MRAILAPSALVALTIACGGGNTPTSPSLPSLPTGSTTIALADPGHRARDRGRDSVGVVEPAWSASACELRRECRS